MKSFISFVLILVLTFCIVSCKKNNVLSVDNSKPTIQADWSLASDTVTLATRLDLAYQGLSGDYYNFAPDGKLYVNEGKYGRDTAEYTLSGDSAVTLTKVYNGVPGRWGGFGNPWKVTVLTAHKMVFTSSVDISGAGAEVEIFTLTK